MRFIVCKNHPNYSVSENGVVQGHRGILRAYLNEKGYLRVSIESKTYRIHRLVAEAFIDNPGNLPEVNHKDGNKLSNHFSNLEWCTRKQNMRHAVDLGLHVLRSGNDSIRAILNQEQVEYIRNVHVPRHPEFGQSALGRKFGVTNSCIWRVVHGDNWQQCY